MTDPIPFSARELEDGVLAGPLREPRNLEQVKKGSIHDDATARRLGLRGGTVAGSLHMEQLPPLLEAALGRRWWETGGLSLYFRFATTDRERVRAFARRPPAAADGDFARTEVWMDREDGTRIAEGTASVGEPDPESTLRLRLRHVPTPRDLRILDDLEAGAECDPQPTRVSREALARRLSVIVEPLPDYTDASRFRGPIAPPSLLVAACAAAQAGLIPAGRRRGVGLYGAIEIQHLAGPVRVERDYEARGRILAVGETPKTEYFWYESVLAEPGGGPDVASMLMMLRFMKASHPAWRSEA